MDLKVTWETSAKMKAGLPENGNSPKNDIRKVAIAALKELEPVNGLVPTTDLNEATCFVGDQAVLDSVGFVMFVVGFEEKLQTHFGLSISFADQENLFEPDSPFRTFGTLVEHVAQLLGETDAG